MTTISLVKVELMRAVMGDTTAVVVDLDSVSFFSCGGLQMLVETRDMARACQVRLRLAVQCRAVLRPMEITGLLDVFHAALGQQRPGRLPLTGSDGDDPWASGVDVLRCVTVTGPKARRLP